jgi:EpsI family protein
MRPGRLYGIAMLLLLSGVGMNRFARQPKVMPALPLSSFPSRLGPWQGADQPLPAPTLAALQLSDYLNRVYTGPGQSAVGLYIAYYPRQRFGDDIHSPKNCLPGAGWQVVASTTVPVQIRGRAIRVNQYIVARGQDRDVVLYWYQQQGRVIASEYWSKAVQVWDGLTQRRSDAALVRVAVPYRGDPARARQTAAAFVGRIYPQLAAYIPR